MKLDNTHAPSHHDVGIPGFPLGLQPGADLAHLYAYESTNSSLFSLMTRRIMGICILQKGITDAETKPLLYKLLVKLVMFFFNKQILLV